MNKLTLKRLGERKRQNFIHFFFGVTSSTHCYYVAYQDKGLAFASPSFPQIIFPATFEVAIFWLPKSAPHVLT